MFQTDDNIRNLNAGVVDIVLNFDFAPGSLQYPDKRITDCGISKVADMRRLVWIDVGVLDDDLAFIPGISA